MERRSLKKIRASTGFEPMTSAIPVRCSTNRAMKPHIQCGFIAQTLSNNKEYERKARQVSFIHRTSNFRNLRATASKYGESHDSSENSDFFLLRQKDPFGELFSEYTFKVPASSHFCEIWESSKYISINQDGRWNLSKIVHFQHASTERRELAWISCSHSL